MEPTEKTTPSPTSSAPLFSLGKICITPGALEALEAAYGGDWLLEEYKLRLRHQGGDGGDLEEGDREANRRAIESGARILSAYTLPDGTQIWIITDGDDDDGLTARRVLTLTNRKGRGASSYPGLFVR